jgi:hypothetical protein
MSFFERSATRTALVGVVIAVVLLQSCTAPQIIDTLDAVVSAAEVAVPVIAAAVNLPPGLASTIVTYLQSVSVAAGKASVIIAGPGTSASKDAQIIAAFAGVVGGALPPGTPAAIATVVQAVAQAVVNFLATIPASTTTIGAALSHSIRVSAADKVRLTSIKTRADVTLVKLKGIKR